MNNQEGKLLSDIVSISRQYQRSIRIDADLGRLDALHGYVRHTTSTNVLASMAIQLTASNQRSFTWTGPFGGGKSSLAIALASALHSDSAIRKAARKALNLNDIPDFDKAFPVRDGWFIVPTVGRRGSVIDSICDALNTARSQTDKRPKPSADQLIQELCSAAADRPNDGVIIFIDEMGKFLEASALGQGDDVYFFQELAEAAARTAGNLVIIGILHQSFSQYATRLGIEVQNDWAKVQGRYLDLPFVSGNDEVADLISKAIQTRSRPQSISKIAQSIGESVRARRPVVTSSFETSLTEAWPLHPAMVTLLGPISRRQFGQNERSTFGFLTSVEPYGFQAYLSSTSANETHCYRPDNYWDYLKANLEPAILASPDGHRWAQAVEAVERTTNKADDPFLIKLIKCVSIIDLFHGGSGLRADLDVLSAIFAEKDKTEIEDALNQLAALRVALYKKHITSWSVFEGSDFDIDAAVKEALAGIADVDFSRLVEMMGIHPVVAKRHYHETGNMRWMNLTLSRLDDVQRLSTNYSPNSGEFGLFVLALPARGMTNSQASKKARERSQLKPWPILVGIPSNHKKIEEFGLGLMALEHVQTRHELTGDAVARREIKARITFEHAQLQEQLQLALSNAEWFDGGRTSITVKTLSSTASDLAEELYYESPAVWSELINRDNLSSSSVKARRELLHRMIMQENYEQLGIEGFPAERGLYETLLRETGLHKIDNQGAWRFGQPVAPGLIELWRQTDKLFQKANKRVLAPEIHKLWSAPPFGVKTGIMPVLFTAYLLANSAHIAVYKDGFFVSRLTDVDIDEYLQDPSRFSLRWVVIDEDKAQILSGISAILKDVGAEASAKDPLEAARGLVALVFELPIWTQRTHQLSERARGVRDVLLKASDPHKVLFVDLASLLGATDGLSYAESLRQPIAELVGAYDAMLRRIEETMLNALDAPIDQLDKLQARAEALTGMTGDLRQDSFATRLATYDGSKESIEGILSLAANKPPRDWTDRDIEAASLEVAKVALRFRQAEAFVSIKGRKPHSEAFAVVIGTGSNTRTIAREFSITDRHLEEVQAKADEIIDQLKRSKLETNVLFAILAKAGMKLSLEESEKSND